MNIVPGDRFEFGRHKDSGKYIWIIAAGPKRIVFGGDMGTQWLSRRAVITNIRKGYWRAAGRVSVDSPATQRRWEYCTQDLGPMSPNDLTEALDTMGEDGWELVTFTPAHRAIFKRALG